MCIYDARLHGLSFPIDSYINGKNPMFLLNPNIWSNDKCYAHTHKPAWSSH